MEQKLSSVPIGDSNIETRGFVCHYQFEDGSSQFVFLQEADRDSGVFVINHSLSFSTKSYVQVECSCKGMLLLSSIGQEAIEFHVFDPNSRQSVTLPQPGIDRRRIIRSGLAFDGVNGHYQVVLVHVAETEEGSAEACFDGLQFQVFSSKTGVWRSFIPSNLFLPVPVPEIEFPELRVTPLYCNGAIHWEINGYLLLYQVENDHCELVELPNVFNDWCWQSTPTYRRCFWESKGRVHYCYTDFEGVHSWVLLNEQDHNEYSYYNIYDRQKFRWALAHSVDHEDLLPLKHLDQCFFQHAQWEPNHASPLSFDEDLETMYLGFQGKLISYSRRSKVSEEICSFTFPGRDYSCCSFFPHVYGDDLQHKVTEGGVVQMGSIDLPISEEIISFSF
ncbi:hypothetical protein K2173_007186 [Erythroxylum novogranatense]|uniref:F-box protein At3g26010-like beta-propeller domain-containing protein n=1 Tax=Erythroxylum novogranatense TaxID=1862640 RepID=A0AAV8SYJ0_9ROSI|nr:hypothetical protein K2173_007186 [Erythroxylum novogranatense]